MIQKTAVYRKTVAGQEALARRDPALSLRLRSLLILADGKRPVEELAKLSGAQADVEPLMGQLLHLGLAEPVNLQAAAQSTATPSAAAQPTARPPAAAAPASGAPTAPTMTLDEARRVAVRRLSDLLGPNSDDLCMRIEATKTPKDFLAMVQRAETMVRGMRGAQHADGFVQALAGYRPT
jgi:hypothetical protein